MTPKLRGMITGLGVFLLAGVGMLVYSPQPATRTTEELKDAGILDGQRLIIICPERLTSEAKKRINKYQPGLLRPSQSYGQVARTARCFNPDGGNCLRPSDGLLRVDAGEAELIIPSLRTDLGDAGVPVDDGGEDNDAIDDSLQFNNVSCKLLTCTQFDDGVTGGSYLSPYDAGCLGGPHRLALQPSPCMIPNGWGRAADGGWCEEECGGEVDCKFTGPYGLGDGGARWNGFNARPREYAVGAACVPVECGVVAGDVPQEWL